MASPALLFFALYSLGFAILSVWSVVLLVRTLYIRNQMKQKNFYDKGITTFTRFNWIIGLVFLVITLVGRLFQNVLIGIGPFLGESKSHFAMAHIPPFFFGFGSTLLITVWRYFAATFTADKKTPVQFFQKQPFRMFVGFASMWVIAFLVFLVVLIDIGAFTDDMEFVESLGLETYRRVGPFWSFIPLLFVIVLIIVFSVAMILRSVLMKEEFPRKRAFLWRSLVLAVGASLALIGNAIPGDYVIYVGNGFQLLFFATVVLWEHFLVELLLQQKDSQGEEEEQIPEVSLHQSDSDSPSSNESE